jgi:hypothetical protein
MALIRRELEIAHRFGDIFHCQPAFLRSSSARKYEIARGSNGKIPSPLSGKIPIAYIART